jgi:hypothetical protein
LSEPEILAAKTRMAHTAAGSIETHGASRETMILIERARGLLDSGTLTQDDREELQELVSIVLASQSAGQTQQSESLFEELLDLLFDLEQ